MTTYRDSTATRERPEPEAPELEAHRRELTGYCYRMLGSGFEAEDAVQETMVRAWRGLDGFDGRASLRSWMYRIATNVCIDMLQGPQRRAWAMDLGPCSTAAAVIPEPLPQSSWILPVPDARAMPAGGDPADLAAYRESVRLAFVVALQHLPPRQRAILILREVLRWQASEVAELLGTTVVSVNSALQRARATIAETGASLEAREPDALDPCQQELLDRYVDAFERYDVAAFVSLLRDDAKFSMPPHPMWLQGPAEVAGWLTGQGACCQGSRLIATSANGCTAFGSYRPAEGGGHEPFAIQVVETSGGQVSGIHNFLFPELFPAFGLPTRLP